jgi:hypothetical protein
MEGVFMYDNLSSSGMWHRETRHVFDASNIFAYNCASWLSGAGFHNLLTMGGDNINLIMVARTNIVVIIDTHSVRVSILAVSGSLVGRGGVGLITKPSAGAVFVAANAMMTAVLYLKNRIANAMVKRVFHKNNILVATISLRSVWKLVSSTMSGGVCLYSGMLSESILVRVPNEIF